MGNYDFRKYLREMKRGEVLAYHTGNLAFDRQDPQNKKRVEIDTRANMVWEAYKAGLLILSQKRLKTEIWEPTGRMIPASVQSKKRKVVRKEEPEMACTQRGVCKYIATRRLAITAR